MELQHHKFGYSGSDINFAVFSDDPCRISYVESIPIPIGHTQVQLYGIEPGARTKWIVVKQLDGPKATLKVFLRQNEKFVENEIDDLPQPEAKSCGASPIWRRNRSRRCPAGNSARKAVG